jgi:hypothetical protein
VDPSLDPVLSWVIRAALGLLMAAAAVHKAVDLAAFNGTLRDYQILPTRFVAFAAPLIVVVEATIAIGLLLPDVAPLAAPLCGGLLLVYSGAIAVNLARGRRHIDCGCLGPRGRGQSRGEQTLSGWLLVRNGVLVAASLLAATPPATRPLLWVDGISIFGGLVVLVLLFQSANLLAAHQSVSSRPVRPPWRPS